MLKGKLAIANARLAYQHFLQAFSGERWDFLASKGARPQRCLWASTSTKNPEYRDVLYVEDLIGPDTVNTMPETTIRAFQEHGDPATRLTQGQTGASVTIIESDEITNSPAEASSSAMAMAVVRSSRPCESCSPL